MWEQVEKLLRTYLDGTLSLDTLEKLIREMRHMLPEEKEQRASQIMELVNAGMTEEEILEHILDYEYNIMQKRNRGGEIKKI